MREGDEGHIIVLGCFSGLIFLVCAAGIGVLFYFQFLKSVKSEVLRIGISALAAVAFLLSLFANNIIASIKIRKAEKKGV